MRLLLDTHALIWALAQPSRLPPRALQAIAETSNQVYASAASAWEIAIKSTLGKLKFPLEKLPASLAEANIAELPVGIRHAQALALLPPLHRDPFDRILVAQAQAEGLTIVSGDSQLGQYPVPLLWQE